MRRLITVLGKAHPIMLQSPKIKEILQKGILLILQHLVFENGFPDDTSRVKIIHHVIKEAARNLRFKDVVSRIHQEMGYAEPLTNTVMYLGCDKDQWRWRSKCISYVVLRGAI